ncbi:MAG: prepilin-type N-terminal cleavage/methylation domain-containing protein [Deltaproteobacteria bacterium]|nr:prepilin-type N-terminal cleavage/methylation domain-containing protein [Deltaproteobacteria bacterium]
MGDRLHIPKSRDVEAGFSLLEVLISVSILGMMSAILYGAFKETLDTQVKVSRSQDRWHVLRIGMARMCRELSMAFVSMDENMAAVNRRTYFVSKRSLDGDSLRFTAFAHRRIVADAHESDESAIFYYLAPDPDEPRKTDLMRRETRRLGDVPFEDLTGESYIMIPDVEGVHFEFYDPVKDDWTEEWDTTSLDGQPNRLPPRVRIYLTVQDESGKDLTLVTEARIELTDALNLSPAGKGSYYQPGSGGRKTRSRNPFSRGASGFGSSRFPSTGGVK